MKKPRGDSRLKTSPPDVQRQVWDILQTRTYRAAVSEVEKQLKLKTSATALGEFFKWYPLSSTMERAKDFGEILKRKLEAGGVDLDDDTVSKAGQVAFEIMAIEDRDQEAYVRLRRLRQTDEKIKADERRIVLLEEKHAAVKRMLEKALKTAKDTAGMSDEARAMVEEAAGMLL
jgi:hypothetical protein